MKKKKSHNFYIDFIVRVVDDTIMFPYKKRTYISRRVTSINVFLVMTLKLGLHLSVNLTSMYVYKIRFVVYQTEGNTLYSTSSIFHQRRMEYNVAKLTIKLQESKKKAPNSVSLRDTR